jgi:hypothetical protein
MTERTSFSVNAPDILTCARQARNAAVWYALEMSAP